MTTRPATFKVPERAEPFVAATENVTSAGPLPLATPWIVIQGTLLLAFHEHAVAVVTRTLAVPPEAPMLCVSGSTL